MYLFGIFFFLVSGNENELIANGEKKRVGYMGRSEREENHYEYFLCYSCFYDVI